MIKEILKIIDWLRIKARLQITDNLIYPYRKEIWWASIGQNIGVEINGKYIIPFINLKGEINSVNISQMRTISNKRLLRRIGEMNDLDFEKIIEIIINSILKTKAPFGAFSESSLGGPSNNSIS